MIVPIFIPHGGCPERCTFCDQKVSGGDPVSLRQVEETLKKHLSTHDPLREVEVAFYGGTFTALSKQLQLKYLNLVKPYPVRIATRPDAIEAEWMKLLRDEYGLRKIELGVQSFNPEVLRALGRSHTVAQVSESRAILKDLGISTGFHLMVGCPMEKSWPEERAALLTELSRLKPDFLRIHPLLVLNGSGLQAEPSAMDSTLHLNEAIERCSDLWLDFEALGIPVIRWGLQANELLGAAVVAGPYHPAFGDLVKGRVLRRAIMAQLADLSPPEPGMQTILIEAHSHEWSSLKGFENCNISWLRQKISEDFGPQVKLGYRLIKTQKEVHGKRNKLSSAFQIRILDPHGASECRKIKFI